MDKKILLFYKEPLATFVQWEHEMLDHPKMFGFANLKKLKHLTAFWKQFLFLLKYKADVYYCMALDYHCLLPALFAKVLNKRLIVVIIGYDAFNRPDIGYGIWQDAWWRKAIARFVLKECDNILTYSLLLGTELYKNVSHNGWRYTYVYPAIPKISKPKGAKLDLAITIAASSSLNNYLRKGIDYYLQEARKHPELTFGIIGVDKLFDEKPDNVMLYGRLSHDEMLRVLKKAKYYYHFARVEGFGISIIEAKACGCMVILGEGHIGAREVLDKDISFFNFSRRKGELMKIING